MPVVVSMLRGVNVGGHQKIKMDALRALYESLGLRNAATYIQSGNVVFLADAQDAKLLARRIEDAMEREFGFRPDVILRTLSQLKAAVAANPFAQRRGLDPRKLLVTFLADRPKPQARKKVLAMDTAPEELRIEGREVYIHFPNGMGSTKLSWPAVAKELGTTGTGRNWNTVQKLVELAEAMERQAPGRS